MYQIDRFSPASSRIAEFHSFADELYRNDPFWISPADPPASEDALCFLLRNGSEVVARACVVVNPELRFRDRSTALVGWYECIDDDSAAAALLDAIIEHCTVSGHTYLIGPMNGSTWHSYRFAERSDDPPFFLDRYNRPWYSAGWERAGFETIARYYSSASDPRGKTYERVERFEKIYRERGVTIRQLRREDFEKELRALHQVSLDGFRDNFLYTPILFDDFRSLNRRLEPYVDPGLVLIAEDENADPLGFIFTLDDIYNREEKSLVIKTVAVVSGGRGRGIGTLLVEKIHTIASDRGYSRVIHALMHEENTSMNIATEGSHICQSYRLFGRSL